MRVLKFLLKRLGSIVVSIAVAVLAFLFEVRVVYDQMFDYCWGLSAGLGSGGSASSLLDALEQRALWSRFGL